MNWQWMIPTKVFYGENVLVSNAESFRNLGSRALIVTGQGGSPKRNGSLDDVVEALEMAGVKWELFAKVEANPSIETVRQGAQYAKNHKADFIVGIGGGSPLDAAKAIAVLAVNEVSDDELFTMDFARVLPVAAVPTTAGTGSEVTPYSIITNPATQSKERILSEKICPRLAFLDPKYTLELPREITLDTAVDAYSHVVEGYLSPRHSPVSDILAREGLAILGSQLKVLATDKALTYENRDKLLYGSLIGGMVITHKGTSIPHAMGFSLTYFKDIPHGRANGMLMPEFINFTLNNSASSRVMELLNCSGFEDIAALNEIMRKLSGFIPKLEDTEIEEYTNIASQVRNIQNNIAIPTKKDLRDLLINSMK